MPRRSKPEGNDGRVWELHMQGFTIARIAPMVGVSEAHAHGIIVGQWLDDKLAAKAAKQAAKA